MSVKKIIAGKITQRLVEAGMSTWSSHQFGIVDRDKVQAIIEAMLAPYDIRIPVPDWMKAKREGKPDAFTK